MTPALFHPGRRAAQRALSWVEDQKTAPFGKGCASTRPAQEISIRDKTTSSHPREVGRLNRINPNDDHMPFRLRPSIRL
jgi:hypothetical protein